jgi:CheY-like chemotaxis protein
VAASGDLWLDGFAAKPLTPDALLEAVIRAHTGGSAAVLLPVDQHDQRLAGLRLLVAEDNALNQEVLAEILTRAGAAVVMVADGLAAVTALRLDGERFDAVLMDIQMPVMDGYSATRLIREELGLRDLPIIAVTAFARPQDREKSRLAGMVGHVVKPLDVEDLVSLLVAQGRGEVSRSAPKIDLSPPALAKIIKLAGLDVETALKAFGGDGLRYLDLLRKFVAQHGGDVDTARRQFAGHEHPGALHVLHGLSGIAGFLQAKGLSRLACTAEEALRDGHAEGMLLLFDELAVAMQTVKDSFYQFEHFYAEPQPVPQPLMPDDPWGRCP